MDVAEALDIVDLRAAFVAARDDEGEAGFAVGRRDAADAFLARVLAEHPVDRLAQPLDEAGDRAVGDDLDAAEEAVADAEGRAFVLLAPRQDEDARRIARRVPLHRPGEKLAVDVAGDDLQHRRRGEGGGLAGLGLAAGDSGHGASRSAKAAAGKENAERRRAEGGHFIARLRHKASSFLTWRGRGEARARHRGRPWPPSK